MLNQSAYTVNVIADNGKEWMQGFALLPQASIYARNVSGMSGLTVVEHNFVMMSDEEMDAFAKLEQSVIDNAQRLEKWARQRSSFNFHNPELYPCEICGKAHSNYECCESCNYGMHSCHFCGDQLGHQVAFSSCYILLEWEENYALLW
jgi:hypothetical protein